MRKYFSQIFKNDEGERSFFATLVISFLITSITSVLVLAVFLNIIQLNIISNTTKKYNQQLLSQTNYTIDEMNTNVEKLAKSLMSNNNVIAFLSLNNRNSNIPVLASLELKNQLLILPYLDSIYLYNSTLDCLYSSENGHQVSLKDVDDPETVSRLNDTKFLIEKAGEPIPSHYDKETDSADLLSYYFPAEYAANGQAADTIIINVKVSSLTDSISYMNDFAEDTDSSFVLLDSEDNYVTGVFSDKNSSAKDWEAAAKDAVSSKSNGLFSSFERIQNQTYFQTHTDSNVYGWKLVNFIPAPIIFKNFILATLIGIFVLILVLFFTFLICMHFARRLNSPVETLTHYLNGGGRAPSEKPTATEGPKEFQMILSSFYSLQEKNQQLRSVNQKTKYSLTQSCLNGLVSDHTLNSPALLQQELEHLGLTYLTKKKICMVVLKIDNYRHFLSEHPSDELWVIRFSIVNIIEELASAAFTCNAFSREDDKFGLLIACDTDTKDNAFEDKLLEIFQSIQENIERYLHFTVSITFSTLFQGLDRFPLVYRNMENALLLKMRYGHNVIINPYQLDDTTTEPFQLSYRLLNQMTDQLAKAQLKTALSSYQKLTDTLFSCDYNEIIPTIIHLIYTVYTRLSEKYPMLKDSITPSFKTFHSTLEYVEVKEDVDELIENFFTNICEAVHKLKEDQTLQNSALTAQKVTQIIEEGYSDPSLCLTSIAEEIGLSANYTGHIFKQYTQKSVSQYILELRMEKLAHYLQTTTLSLNDILDKVGLEKNNYFYTRFKNYFGISLNEYREKYQKHSEES